MNRPLGAVGVLSGLLAGFALFAAVVWGYWVWRPRPQPALAAANPPLTTAPVVWARWAPDAAPLPVTRDGSACFPTLTRNGLATVACPDCGKRLELRVDVREQRSGAPGTAKIGAPARSSTGLACPQPER